MKFVDLNGNYDDIIVAFSGPSGVLVLGRDTRLPTRQRILHHCISRAHVKVAVQKSFSRKGSAQTITVTRTGRNAAFLNDSPLELNKPQRLKEGDVLTFLETTRDLPEMERSELHNPLPVLSYTTRGDSPRLSTSTVSRRDFVSPPLVDSP